MTTEMTTHRGFTANTCAYKVGCWEDSEYGGCLCVPCFDAGKSVNPYVEYTALPAKHPTGMHRIYSVFRVETRCEHCGHDVEGYIVS